MDKYKDWICGIDTNNQTIYSRPCKNSIYRGEALEQEFALLDYNYSDITVSYTQNGQLKVVKQLEDLIIDNEKIFFTLTEDDTLAFIEDAPVYCQIMIIKDDGTIVKSRKLLSYVLRSYNVRTGTYSAYAYAIGDILSTVQIRDLHKGMHYLLLTADNSWDQFDVIFKDEYNHVITAEQTRISLNKFSIVIPAEVLEKPGKIYLALHSDEVDSCISNAMRVEVSMENE